MEEDFDFEETVTTLIREAEWKTVRREAAQQAVGRVVGRAGRFEKEYAAEYSQDSLRSIVDSTINRRFVGFRQSHD
jgi:hypothetical protein